MTNFTTPDTMNSKIGVSEQYTCQEGRTSSSDKPIIIRGRLYQFSTQPNYKGEMIFGTIFELGYQQESRDLDIIRQKLLGEIKEFEKFKESETETGKIVIDKAIENIKNTIIWKIETKTEDKNIYMYKYKIAKAEDLINAKKS